jgi:transketolase
MPENIDFYVPEEALVFYRQAIDRGAKAQAEWQARAEAAGFDPDREFRSDAWLAALPSFAEALATRKASHTVLNALAPGLPNLLSGCADLAESVYTDLHGLGVMLPDLPTARNVAYGIREHGMAAAVNGLNLHGGLKAFGGTFLIFSDYCRPALRLAALMEVPSIFAFSHDSIGLGEDGPTHQPVEHLMALRAIPNFNVLRPADGNETAACWKIALQSKKTPCAVVLSRQSLPALTPDTVTDHPAEKGAYVLREASTGKPEVILIGTGSEVSLAVAARDLLEASGVPTRVVSMPSWLLFEAQEAEYRSAVLPKGIPTVSVEAGTTLGWARYAQAHVGLDHFGASAPAAVLFEKFGFTAEHVMQTAKALLGF